RVKCAVRNDADSLSRKFAARRDHFEILGLHTRAILSGRVVFKPQPNQIALKRRASFEVQRGERARHRSVRRLEKIDNVLRLKRIFKDEDSPIELKIGNLPTKTPPH